MNEKQVPTIGLALSKDNVVDILKTRKAELSTHGVSTVGLFGSYARNEQSNKSDIDLLIDFEPGKENFDNLMAVYDLLETVFGGKKIEVVTKNGLSKHIGPAILKTYSMSKEPIEFLRHILDECTYLLSVSNDLSKDDFLKDENAEKSRCQKFGNYWRSDEKDSD